jgi:hypothetical protein
MVVVAQFVDEQYDRYAIATYVEGTVTVKRFGSSGGLYRAVDSVAEHYWRRGVFGAPDDLPSRAGLLPEHRGPYWRPSQQPKEGESEET